MECTLTLNRLFFTSGGAQLFDVGVKHGMHRPIMTVGLATALALSLVTLTIAWRSPGNNQGYAPVQPIAFSHKLHAGDMQVRCEYCHLGTKTSRYAGIPAVSTCMNCHRSVTTSFAAQKQSNPP